MGEEIELTPGRIIAGRYQVLEQVGAAAFSRAVQVLDLKDDTLLCLKVVKVREERGACGLPYRTAPPPHSIHPSIHPEVLMQRLRSALPPAALIAITQRSA